MGLRCSDAGRVAFISGLSRSSVLLHGLLGPPAERHRAGRLRRILAGKRQSTTALLLLHPNRLLHDPAAVREHLVLRHQRQSDTLSCARGAVEQGTALEAKAEKDLHFTGGLGACICTVLAAFAGEIMYKKCSPFTFLMGLTFFYASRRPFGDITALKSTH